VQQTYVPAQVLTTTTDNFKQGQSQTHGDLGAGKGSEFGYSVKGRLKATMVECQQNNEVDDDSFTQEAVGSVNRNNDLCSLRGCRHSTGCSDNGRAVQRIPRSYAQKSG
jgi:hypothetical protein